ncbi:hypothetical protein EV424DRAFT_1431183, partial [Suillus variegatus]
MNKIRRRQRAWSVETLRQVRIIPSRATSSVDHCAGPSTESGGKISKVKTKKKASPTTRKVKATDDDEGTLVEVPRPKTHSKRRLVIVTIEPDDEDAPIPDNKPAAIEPWAVPKFTHKWPSAKDAPLNRVQAKQRTYIRKEHMKVTSLYMPTCASRVPKCSKRTVTEVDEESPNLLKTKIYGSLTVDIPMKKSPERSAPDDDVSGDVKQPLKKPNNTVKKPHSVMKEDTKKKKAHPQESDDEDHMSKKPVSKKAIFDEEPRPGYVLSICKNRLSA